MKTFKQLYQVNEDNLDLVMKAGKAKKPIEIKLRDGKYKLDDYQTQEIYKAMKSKRGKDVINIVRNMFDKNSKVQSAEIAYNDISRSF